MNKFITDLINLTKGNQQISQINNTSLSFLGKALMSHTHGLYKNGSGNELFLSAVRGETEVEEAVNQIISLIQD